jgi:O-antigen/teichoic acid export membrane protein
MGLALFIGYHRFRQFSTVTALMEVLRMISSLAMLLLGFGTLGLVYGFLLSRIVGLAALWRLLPFDLRFRLSHPDRRSILRFGGWLHGGSVMSVVNAKVVDGLLTSFMGTAALAAYTTALQVPNITLKFFESVRPVVLSYIAALKLAAQRAAVLGVRLLTALLTLASGLTITFASPIIGLLYSSRYLSSVPIMQALSVWAAVGIINYFLSLTLIGLGRPKAVFLVTLPQFAVMLFSTVMLVPKYSGFGAALSLLITAVAGNVITTWLVSNRDLKLYRALNAAFLRSALPLFGLFLLTVLTRPNLLLGIGYLLLLLGLLRFLGSITPRDLKLLFAQARQRTQNSEENG